STSRRRRRPPAPNNKPPRSRCHGAARQPSSWRSNMEAAPVSDAEYNLTTPGPPANGDGPSSLTDAEVQRLILATLHGCEGGCTKAHHVRMDSVLLDLI